MSQHRERRSMQRVLAGIGAAALTLLGTVSLSTAASALTVHNINPETSASLTIHKHAGTPGDAGDGTLITAPAAIAALGAGLEGVQFSVERVTHDGSPIDLTTAAGWDDAQGATVANVSAGTGGYDTELYQAGVTTLDGGTVTLPAMPFGLYLVTETSPGANPIVSPVQPFLVSVPYPATDSSQWIYDVHVYPKNMLNTTQPEKTVAAPDSLTLGSEFVWTITAPVPDIAANDTYRSFSVTDTLDPRLTLTDTVVRIGSTVAELGVHYSQTGNTVITLLAPGLSLLPAADNVTVELTTTVTSLTSGDLPPGEISNEAIVQVNDSAVETGPAKTNWGPLQIVKVAAEDATRPLAGATFTLHETEGGPALTPPGELTTDDDGLITIDGLWIGNGDVLSKTYWLQEIAAPAGYILPEGTDAWTSYEVTPRALSETFVPTPISNTQQDGPTLPLTGSTGTLLFMGGGIALVFLAVGTALLASRKKHGRLVE